MKRYLLFGGDYDDRPPFIGGMKDFMREFNDFNELTEFVCVNYKD